MRITSVMILTILVVALSVGTASRAKAAEGAAMTFTGQVQGVDVAQSFVVVRGPKPGTESGNASGQVSVRILVAKMFKVDKTATISVGGKSKTNLADVKNGDPIEISYVQAPNGQFLAKSVTDSAGPPANQTSQPSHY